MFILIIHSFFFFLVSVDTRVEVIGDDSEDIHETSFIHASPELFDTDELLLRLPSRKLSKFILLLILKNLIMLWIFHSIKSFSDGFL